MNGKSAKPSTPVAVGSTVEARAHGRHRIFEVTQVIDKRVGAAIAAGCYVDHSPPEPEQDRVRVAEPRARLRPARPSGSGGSSIAGAAREKVLRCRRLWSSGSSPRLTASTGCRTAPPRWPWSAVRTSASRR